ncbi:hypothetical protein KQI42_18100 [Tissierella sp. MSJ-40]|uniref:Uncharacterized protein n=1 Tax=Tissierella simiarum TaxID=2841534 RepID=A0ABS6EAG7_9FIRM|nr:hypothetical protein [Tissierella simiarum]MBU5439925.1 hypothetical protein [Tissierella simiarum]
MQMLIIVLNNLDKLDDLLMEFTNSSILGATIIDSMGMIRALADEHEKDLPLFGSLKMMLNENRPFNKTIFTVLPDEKIPIAMDCVRKVVGDLNKEGVGIMFTLPIKYVEGITK